MILIITNKEDVHPNPVIDKLNGFPFFRVNTEDLLTSYQIIYTAIGGHYSFSIKNNVTEQELHSDQITAIWERRPELVDKLPTKIEDALIETYCLNEATGFFRYLRYSMKDRFWIGNPITDRLAESKMLQTQIARELNMKCTDSIYSNNPEAIRKFVRNYDHVCVKPIYEDQLTYSDRYISFGANKVKPSDFTSIPDDSLAITVHYVQEYIEKEFELRVTVVCDKIFACKILSQEQGDSTGKVDWRDGLDKGLKHEIFELPDDVSRFCIEYLKKTGQQFGAFDFIVTPGNEYVFLECNSNGQWYWVELETGMDISGAIAEHLKKGSW